MKQEEYKKYDLNIYKLTINPFHIPKQIFASCTEGDYIIYVSSMIVVAPNEEESKNIHPLGYISSGNFEESLNDFRIATWASKKEYVNCEYIGKADDKFEIYSIIHKEYETSQNHINYFKNEFKNRYIKKGIK